jgi:formate-dependent nitrite reductase membrane component NrfD
MKKTIKIQFGTILLVLAALVNLARWTGLFTFSDHAPAWIRDVIPILDAISGLFTGLAVAGGLAFVVHRLGGLQPFTPTGKPVMRFWTATVSTVAILVLSAFLLPPYIRMSTPMELRAEISNLDAWSVMAVLVGDLIIVAIAAVDSKSAGFTRSKPEPRPKTRSAKPSGRSKKAAARSADFACKYQCGKAFPSQNAANAHAGKCKFKPTISMPKEEAKV